MKNIFGSLLGRADGGQILPRREPTLSREDPTLSKKDYKQYSKIVEPVAKDERANLNITVTDGSQIFVQLHLDSNEANAVQNRIRSKINGVPDVEKGVHEKELLYLFQARSDVRSTAGDKAKIDKFSKRALNLVFASEDVKRAMIDIDDNPFNMIYVVDVEVNTVNEKPASYKVLKVHEAFERPE